MIENNELKDAIDAFNQESKSPSTSPSKKTNEKIIKIITYCTFIYSSIFSIALIVLLSIPKSYPQAFDSVNMWISGLHNIWVLLAAFSGSIVTIVGLLFKPKKDDGGALFKKIVTLVIICLLLFLPIAINAFGMSVMDYYNKTIEESKSSSETTENDIETNNDPPNVSEPSNISFIIQFNDPLMTSYDIQLLIDNKSILKNDIINKLKSIDKDFNKNCDLSEYETKLSEVEDYEKAYKFFYDENLFKKERDERIDFLNKCIKLRKSANDNYCTSENQRLIGLRHKDKAYEEYMCGNISDAIDLNKTSIYWYMTSVNSFYNENVKNYDCLNKSINDIISSYNEIANMTDPNSEDHKRAEYLSSLYSEIYQSLCE